jgi:uncharacterized Zn-binding protein involved in type VI secretion
MARLVRQGDINSAGGRVMAGHTNILCNFRPVALQGSVVSAHPPCPKPPIHCAAIAAKPGRPRVLANGIPVLVVGDVDTCGHARAQGSLNTVVFG